MRKQAVIRISFILFLCSYSICFADTFFECNPLQFIQTDTDFDHISLSQAQVIEGSYPITAAIQPFATIDVDQFASMRTCIDGTVGVAAAKATSTVVGAIVFSSPAVKIFSVLGTSLSYFGGKKYFLPYYKKIHEIYGQQTQNDTDHFSMGGGVFMMYDEYIDEFEKTVSASYVYCDVDGSVELQLHEPSKDIPLTNDQIDWLKKTTQVCTLTGKKFEDYFPSKPIVQLKN